VEYEEVMQLLESLGTEQNRKTYSRHGASPPMFGVSFANLRKLAKKIKVDHDLAVRLWHSGNMDARTLAASVADPARLSPEEAEAWVGETTCHGLLDELVFNTIAKAPYADKKLQVWIDSPREYVGRAGWLLVAVKAGARWGAAADYPALISRIEREIHSSPNRKKEAMNTALISIGIYQPEWRDLVMAAAERIGKVVVDHGDTSCKTPDARAYITKALARKS